jgi:hypothetical protein
MADRATVTVYIGNDTYRVTGAVKREYPKGLTVEDERGVIHYATFDRVQRTDGGKAWLW